MTGLVAPLAATLSIEGRLGSRVDRPGENFLTLLQQRLGVVTCGLLTRQGAAPSCFLTRCITKQQLRHSNVKMTGSDG
jgi:hypothetical protein